MERVGVSMSLWPFASSVAIYREWFRYIKLYIVRKIEMNRMDQLDYLTLCGKGGRVHVPLILCFQYCYLHRLVMVKAQRIRIRKIENMKEFIRLFSPTRRAWVCQCPQWPNMTGVLFSFMIITTNNYIIRVIPVLSLGSGVTPCSPFISTPKSSSEAS